MYGIGEELKAARQKRGLTFNEVFKSTKIDPRFLQALEEENFEILPEPYIKAFLRSYALEIGANLASIMRKYEEMRSPSQEEPIVKPEANSTHPPKFVPYKDALDQLRENSEIIWKSYKRFALPVLGGVVIIALLIALLSVRPKTNIESFLNEEEAEPATVSAKGIPLTVKALKSLYLMVSIDGGDSLDYNISAGDSKEFHAEHKFWMLTSDAAASSFTLNGKTLDKIAGTGLCAQFTADSSGVSNIKTYKQVQR